MQNLVTLNLTADQLTAVDAALTELEKQLAGLVALSSAAKRAMKQMGPKSEAFCRQTLNVLQQNPQIVPPNVPLAQAVAELGLVDLLRPRLVRLSRLSDRAADTDFALGSNVMSVALQGYSLLKLTGHSEGLEALRQSLGERFAKGPRQAQPTPAPQAIAPIDPTPLARAA